MVLTALLSALKRAAWDDVGFTVAGSGFTAREANQAVYEMLALMGEAAALDYIKKHGVQNDD